MMCFKTGWAALLDVSLWVSWANIGTFIVATVAVCVAYNQWDSSKVEARRATAYSAYSKFLELCQEFPDFAYAKEKVITVNQSDYIKYRWFVAQMLFAFEQILDVAPNDKEWNVVISNQLKRHAWHLKKSSSVVRKEWRKSLQDLITEVCK